MWTRKLHGSGTAAKPGWEGMRGQTGRGEGESCTAQRCEHVRAKTAK